MTTAAQETVKALLSEADVHVNGNQAFDIRCLDPRVYDLLLAKRELGLGEAYMEGWWDTDRLDELMARLLSTNVRKKLRVSPEMFQSFLGALIQNPQDLRQAKQHAEHHYNIGNDLYSRMLDQRMIYSCAYWEGAETLDEAQTAKLDLICRKLHLEKGMTLLDIGCGWGGFAEYATAHYDVVVTGITPAEEQVWTAKDRVRGLPVTILEGDYRTLPEKFDNTFDRIVSIGMLEHVGSKNYHTFFNRCHRLLKDGGLMLHQVIGANASNRLPDPWIEKYIFPGGVLPSLAQLSRSVENLFVIEDVHNFGPDYDKTLMAWHANFVKRFPEIGEHYGQRFYRMWCYYLLSCAGAFRARHLQLWQLVMRKIEPSETYRALR